MGFPFGSRLRSAASFHSQSGSNAARLWLFIAREPLRRLSGRVGYNTLAPPRQRGWATFKSNANQAAASRVIFNRTKSNKRSHVAQPWRLIVFSDRSGASSHSKWSRELFLTHWNNRYRLSPVLDCLQLEVSDCLWYQHTEGMTDATRYKLSLYLSF